MVGRRIIVAGVFFLLAFARQGRAITVVQESEDFPEIFITAVNSARLTDSLYERMKEVHLPNAYQRALFGYVLTLKAKHAWNPISKLAFLKKGGSTIDHAVLDDPKEVGIRYIRYLVEANLPKALGCSAHLSEDRGLLVAYLKAGRGGPITALVMRICNLLIRTVYTSAEELAYCKKLLLQAEKQTS